LASLSAIRRYETSLVKRLIERVSAVPGLRVHGITDPARGSERCPTIAFTIEGHRPRDISSFLGQRGIYTWDGHYYAWELIGALGLSERGGMVRVGLVHYNTAGEIERLGAALDELTDG
jgi:selenocysteine lyase/cysteine desulfurase